MFRSDKRGQNLLELVVALGVISLGLATMLGLSVITTQGNRASRQRFLAYNLAREGIELTRQLRDSNYLASRVFDTDLTRGYKIIDAFWTQETCPGGCPDTNASWIRPLDLGNQDCFANLPWNESCHLYRASATSQYGHEPRPELDQATPFYRQLIVSDICDNGNVPGPQAVCGSKVVGKQITSEAKWREGAKISQVRLTERLYDWRLSNN